MTSKLVPQQITTGRTCGTCTLCCKLLPVEDLAKPRLEWCTHCDPTKGCKIYDTRPEACRTFRCIYLTDARLSDAWKPSKCKFLMRNEPDANRLVIDVDPGRPDAWTREPYYKTIKQWAEGAARDQGQIIVCIGAQTIAVLPQTNKHLGVVRDDQRIVSSVVHGIVADIFVVDAFRRN